jgi:type VI secretion system ImpM family protein
MLGSLGRSRRWCWAAVGKHPAAMDYIRLGDPSPLLDALADWAAKGYEELLRKAGRPPGPHSWRFWLRSVKKGELIYGLGRDSSDRIGRPFPLLIMGQGPLKGWEKHWDMLAGRLDRTWEHLEYIASHRFDGARSMEEEILALRQRLPAALPPRVTKSPQPAPLDAAASACRQQLLDGGFGMIRLNDGTGEDSDLAIVQSHAALARCCRQIPRSVFIGGTVQHTYLAVVEHPLGAADFARLWTV